MVIGKVLAICLHDLEDVAPQTLLYFPTSSSPPVVGDLLPACLSSVDVRTVIILFLLCVMFLVA